MRDSRESYCRESNNGGARPTVPLSAAHQDGLEAGFAQMPAFCGGRAFFATDRLTKMLKMLKILKALITGAPDLQRLNVAVDERPLARSRRASVGIKHLEVVADRPVVGRHVDLVPGR